MRLVSILLVVVLARPGVAQSRDSTQRAPGTTVSGIVHDSIGRLPLSGATVQLLAADSLASIVRTTVSDSLGRFTLGDVPDGRYRLGFLHPMLDSLGVDPPLRAVHVDGRRPVRADLGIPSPARLRAAICGSGSAPDSGAVLVGVVRDARDRAPAAGVKVVGEWLELSLRAEGVVRRTPRLVATTGDNGWFAMCNVPRAGTMMLIASRDADSTDLVEVQVPADGFLRRELYLGGARAVVVTGDTTPRADTLAPPLGSRRTGDGRLSGKVVAAVGGRPVASALISISGGPQSRANDQGEWRLAGVPLGTRMLEVRAVGYYPERRAVDVVAGAPPIRTALSTMKAVLDTVRVTASRQNRNMIGFAERRRSGVGRYLTPEDIARRQPVVTSDLFRMVPGLRVDRTPIGDTEINMRGTFAERCSPAVYIDGNYMRILGAADIDDWVGPEEVAGIEIYAAGTVPQQFQPGLNGCGSIVIWTRLRPGPSSREPMKRRVLKVLGVAAFGLFLGAAAR
jgi:hypothetical protein